MNLGSLDRCPSSRSFFQNSQYWSVVGWKATLVWSALGHRTCFVLCRRNNAVDISPGFNRTFASIVCQFLFNHFYRLINSQSGYGISADEDNALACLVPVERCLRLAQFCDWLSARLAASARHVLEQTLTFPPLRMCEINQFFNKKKKHSKHYKQWQHSVTEIRLP
ncbi:hypothetical protein RRG08_052346 [Elysia crispata]|uniref:Uncharacterized protein n=1 Tax=Elysia crispata TaxID=231223 RepID=A0AAE1A6S0_9GAST|nr:hypothetical protein RRG08_052346 [Elysia crispata]